MTPASATRLRACASAVLALALASAPVPAADPGSADFLDPSPERARQKAALVAGGLEFPVSGSQGIQPQIAAYVDLPRNLQVGLKARVDLRSASEAYDYLPQAGLHLRQLWLSDQDTSTVRGSEYISLAAGLYPAYGFDGSRSGPRPFGAVVLGKYWMPFEGGPYGLDFSLEITRFFDGHPPGKARNHFVSAGVSLFRAFPRPGR